jgi:glycosyltransferase involved in cell wall biosynthesis
MTRKNRILFATSGTAPGYRRESLYADHVARALAPWYDLDVLCPMIGRSGHVIDFHGARLLRVPLPSEGAEGAEALARAMRRQLSDGLYDAVHVRTPVEGEAALALHEQCGYTLVYEPSPPSQLMGFLADPGAQAALRRLHEVEQGLVTASDVLVVHSGRAFERAARARGSEDDIVRIPPGVDVDCFCPMPLTPEEPPFVLVLDDPHAGLGEMPTVRSRLLDEPWGPESWKPETAPDLALALAGSAACLLLPPPTWSAWLDATPYGILEASACLRPVIAPRLPDVMEVLGEGCEPLLYDPDVPGEAVRLSVAVLEQPRDYGRLVESIGSHVRAAFPASVLRARLVSLYAGLVEPHAEPPLAPVPASD